MHRDDTTLSHYNTAHRISVEFLRLCLSIFNTILINFDLTIFTFYTVMLQYISSY